MREFNSNSIQGMKWFKSNPIQGMKWFKSNPPRGWFIFNPYFGSIPVNINRCKSMIYIEIIPSQSILFP
jgi:hypothetical protein